MKRIPAQLENTQETSVGKAAMKSQEAVENVSARGTVSFILNGEKIFWTGDLSKKLLDVLRDDLRLTSVKCGCREGECGACSVLLDGLLVNSCLVAIGSLVAPFSPLSEVCAESTDSAANKGNPSGAGVPSRLKSQNPAAVQPDAARVNRSHLESQNITAVQPDAVRVNKSGSISLFKGVKPERLSEVITLEGYRLTDRFAALNCAFAAHSAVQCGYCIPGMVLASEALLSVNPHPTEQEIRTGLSGNLCRCTGYSALVSAIQDAAKEGEGLW